MRLSQLRTAGDPRVRLQSGARVQEMQNAGMRQTQHGQVCGVGRGGRREAAEAHRGAGARIVGVQRATPQKS